MENIEELLQQLILQDDTYQLEKLGVDDEKKRSSQAASASASSTPPSGVKLNISSPSSRDEFNKVKVPISMALLDHLNALKSLPSSSPSSPNITSLSSPPPSTSQQQQSSTNTSDKNSSDDKSNTGTTTTTTPASPSVEYDKKVALINELVEKIISKYITPTVLYDAQGQKISSIDDDLTIDFQFPFNHDENPLVSDILNSYDTKREEEEQEEAMALNDPSRSPSNVFGPLKVKSESNASHRTCYRVNWKSLIVKLHQSILLSGLYQNLLKKISNENTSSQLDSSQTLFQTLKDPKLSKQVSLSSSSLLMKPASKEDPGVESNKNSPKMASAAAAVIEETRSTPTTPGNTSPMLKKGETNILDSPKKTNISGNAPGTPGKSSQQQSVTGSSSSSNFSLSALMAGQTKDAPPALKELAERSMKIDQNKFGIQVPASSSQPPMYPNNPNMNKLPSSYETDPILLPDGSEFSNARVVLPSTPTSSSASSSIPIFNVGSSGAPTSLAQSPSPSSMPIQMPASSMPIPLSGPSQSIGSNLFSPPTNPLSTSFGAPPRFSTSPYQTQPQQISSGMPPTRLTESFFPTSSSRGPPSYDGNVNSTPTIQIPQTQNLASSSMMSVSPSPSSLLTSNPLSLSGSFNRPSSMGTTNQFPPNIELNPISINNINSAPTQQQQQSNASSLTSMTASPSNIASGVNVLNLSGNVLPQQPIPQVSPQMPAIDTMVPASSSFKATPPQSSSASSSANGSAVSNQSKSSTVQSLNKPITGLSDVQFPEWLDITIYWNKSNNYLLVDENSAAEKDISNGINIEVRSLILAERSGGRLDHLLEAKLISLINQHLLSIIESKTVPWIEAIYNNWIKSVNVHYFSEISRKLSSTVTTFNSHLWNSRKYNAFLDRIVNLKRHYPGFKTPQDHVQVTSKGAPIPLQLTSQKEEQEMKKIIKQLEQDILYLISIQHQSSLKHLERLLIGLMGHTSTEARQSSVRLLNVIYDSHSWQFDEPLKPVIRVIGDAFHVEIELESPLPEEVLKRVHILTVVPSSQRISNLIHNSSAAGTQSIKTKQQHRNRYLHGVNSTLFTRHKPKVEGNKLYVDLPSFYRAGYYDWRIVELTSNGTYVPFDYSSFKLKTLASRITSPQSNSATTANPDASSENEFIQGRFIVHPKLREEIMHEVWVDLNDSVWDPSRGDMVKKGNLQNLIDSLDNFYQDGVTTLYVMGVLEKLPNNQPLCPTDRDLPNRSLGGTALFNQMMNKAKQLGIKIVIDSTTRLSSKAAHRKYNGVICHTLDNNGQLCRLEGTDSSEFTWSDCVMMNMRKQSVWEMFVQETLLWGERGVDGIRIDSAHTCPLIFRSNLDELYRLDSDDLPHYSNQQIFEGEIVMKPSEEGKNFGYWGTTPPSPKHSTPFYPNPVFIKMTREVWNRFPQFVFLAEVYWERELHSIISGLVPYSSAIPKALASVFDKGISKDGIVFDLRQRNSVKTLYDYYEMRMSTYPQNSIILFPSSTHHSPYPLSIYNAGAWAAVDMLYFLPEIPITYIGEQFGWYYHVDIHTSRVKVGMSSTPYQLQYPQIRGHYAHRINLRKTHALLRRGGMIPLLCYHQNGWHDRVFGFARFSGNEIAIIAINFDNHDTEFYVDCSPLAKIATQDTIYRMVDLINPNNPPQYLSLNEFLYEKHFVLVPGYSSICWGVYHQVSSPAAMRVLYEHSMTRLKQLLADDVDPSNNLIYSLIKNSIGNVNDFGKALTDILSNLSGHTEKTFSSFIQNVLYHLTRTHMEGYKILSYLEVLSKRTNIQRIPSICKETLQHNILGPIVFITPEIGRFSTVGGVGVMLDELTRSLQLLGCEIHIISPYYNYGKGGRTGYLEKEEGIKWKRNVLTYVGPDRVEVGVHEGIDKGIHLHFLHHFEYFPTPYNAGSPIHQLKTIVLFAKASLELLCQIRVLPSVIVTNDWFCGLVPGYAKSGAFGTTFNGTTLFHLVHNLEEAYQGRIYPDGGQDDLNWIHHLHRDLIVDPSCNQLCLNASRCALLTSNNWGTVSKSYLYDLLRTSHLANLLHRFPQAFAHSNGIRVRERKELMEKVSKDHWSAKEELQKKYFNSVDRTIPVFSFVGRIVLQKGVHLILNAVRELIQYYQGKIQILVGGMANMKDPYAASCAWSMQALCKQFPNSFWADPDSFFSDGPLVNLGSDFGLMPSLFEPSGVVQQEYFVAGTPVIAFKTGGLKDTVFEYSTTDESGNGFTFEAHKHTDYVQAIHRSYNIYQNPHHYQTIRQKASESVLDMSVVAEAWAKEFSRMRRSIWADQNLVQEYSQKLLNDSK
ncbi:hypothetical protein CYY_003097 [Polysphondylium violaceum]|uniref:Glycosyl hydrolase family 13 catalytic domain-containing protein n=1 Tax=Polysphondylium violaceum TaxID=133409 RepID=A0A8J4PYZ9_9MYCE|nr:hypothetical protein CYY_003097 [Polysphondylium violaceum]